MARCEHCNRDLRTDDKYCRCCSTLVVESLAMTWRIVLISVALSIILGAITLFFLNR
jgi:RNA polymerase subunit RPABC4/transcription elongation factor Spt4